MASFNDGVTWMDTWQQWHLPPTMATMASIFRCHLLSQMATKASFNEIAGGDRWQRWHLLQRWHQWHLLMVEMNEGERWQQWHPHPTRATMASISIDGNSGIYASFGRWQQWHPLREGVASMAASGAEHKAATMALCKHPLGQVAALAPDLLSL